MPRDLDVIPGITYVYRLSMVIAGVGYVFGAVSATALITGPMLILSRAILSGYGSSTFARASQRTLANAFAIDDGELAREGDPRMFENFQ